MRNLTVTLIIVAMLLTLNVPAHAGNVLTAVPSDYYADILVGAVIQGVARSQSAAPLGSLYISVGIAVTREIVDCTLLGGKIDWTRAAAMVLGSSFVYYF